MKLTTAILALGLSLGTAWAQNPDVIGDTRNTLQNVQKKQTIDQNAALAASGQGQSGSSAQAPAAVTAPAKWVPSQAAASNPVPAKVNPPAAKQAKTTVIDVAPGNAPKTATAKGTKESTAIAVNPPAEPQPTVAVEDKKNPAEPKKEEEEPKTYSAAGRRDPFISPVVSRTMLGSGCNAGKRCLAIDQINLQGVVKSDSGMIAVVVNALNKAYFLHENDPVFNGYVVKITGDSIIFKETIQDKMGKPFEREVTKKISTPAV
ncbi:MAG: pilus assembly protein PilP [Terriglobales bacterium]